jgi:hypothetical protein
MTPDSHVANIGERGARRRRAAGIALSVLAAAALIVLLLSDAPSWSRLLVGIPAGLGAAEILQAREKT